MDARWLWRWCAGCNYREGPRVIGKERVSVWRTVVEILIVHVCMEDRYRALFTKMETGVRRDVITLRTVVRSNCCAVVLARVSASDVKPTANNVNRFTEVNGHRGV